MTQRANIKRTPRKNRGHCVPRRARATGGVFRDTDFKTPQIAAPPDVPLLIEAVAH